MSDSRLPVSQLKRLLRPVRKDRRVALALAVCQILNEEDAISQAPAASRKVAPRRAAGKGKIR